MPLIRPSALELRFHTGIVAADKEPTQTLLWRVRSALNEAKTKGIDTVVWHPGLPAGKEFSPILSQGSVSHMSLTSLIFNLFDRSVSITAACEGGSEVFISADGGQGFAVRPDDRVIITRSDLQTRLIRLKGNSFYRILQQKL